MADNPSPTTNHQRQTDLAAAAQTVIDRYAEAFARLADL